MLDIWRVSAVLLFQVVRRDVHKQGLAEVCAKVLELLLLKVVQEVVQEIYHLADHPRQVDYMDFVGPVPIELRCVRHEIY